MTDKSSNPFKNGGETGDIKIEDSEIKNLNETEPSEESKKEEEKNKTDEKKESEKAGDKKLQEAYDKLNQQYIRLAADFDNYRKRQEQERENLIQYGTESALKKMLEILDNFERGQKTLEGIDDCEKVKESFQLIHKQVWETLSKLGLEEIKAVGENFDPNFHEAVMQTPTTEHPEHTVINELQKGYKLGDKILRPTLVNVATQE